MTSLETKLESVEKVEMLKGWKKTINQNTDEFFRIKIEEEDGRLVESEHLQGHVAWVSMPRFCTHPTAPTLGVFMSPTTPTLGRP